MKKLFTSFAFLLAFSLSGNAQVYQIPNSDFSSWGNNEPGSGWYSFASAGGSMAGIGGSSAPKPSKDTDRSGDTNSNSCKIFSKSILGQKANGNLTTGKINMGSMKPADASNHNYTDRAGSNKLLFAGRPDAVEFYAKFTSGGSPNGRGQFILHGDVDYRDPEVSDQASYKVGIASVLIPASSEWVRYEGAFTYSQKQPATQYMLASFTTNPTPGGSSGDYLWIDDVKLIYYHSLSALSYEGSNLSFNESTLSYDLSNQEYEAAKLAYTVKGVGATAETSFNESSKLLTITVKGNDYAANSSSLTAYTLQFAGGTITPEPEPGPDTTEAVVPVEPQPLGTTPVALSEINAEKTYVMYNSHFTAYAIYNPEYSETNIWTAEMIGDAGHPLNTSNYAHELDSVNANSCWVVTVKSENTVSVFNVGAQKYLTTPGYANETKPCTLTEEETVLTVVDLGNGAFAFTATGNEKDYMCAAPQGEGAPISIWESSDTGAAWMFFENPNIAPDGSVVEPEPEPEPEPDPNAALPFGAPIQSLSEIDMTKTYVLYNAAYTAFATYNSTYSSTTVWTAGMIGGNDADHALANSDYSVALDTLDAGSSWMILKENDLYYIYNVGAKQFLTSGRPCAFTAEKTNINIAELGDGKFAFSTSGGAQDYVCASPQMTDGPLAVWETSDAGCQWQIMENPNVDYDPTIMPDLTGIDAIVENDKAEKNIYTISGVKINAENADKLPAGLYIINGKKRIVK